MRLVCLASLPLLVACAGVTPPTDAPPVDTDEDPALPACAAPPVRMHRLTRLAFDRSLREVFGVDLHPGASLPADSVTAGFPTTSEGQSVSGAWLAQALRAGGDVVDAALAVPAWSWTLEAEDGALRGERLEVAVGTPGTWIFLTRDGSTSSTVAIPEDGTYRLGFRGAAVVVYPDNDEGDAEGPWPDVRITVDGAEVGRIEVDGEDMLNATWGVEVDLTEGEHLIGWTFDIGHPTRLVQVDRMEVERARRTYAQRRTPSRDRVIVCDPYGEAAEACHREILERAGRRLWRRPLDNTELGALLADVAVGESVDDGLALALHHLIASPHFLYLPEAGADGAPRALDAWEVAARLADVLWASVPDETLLDCAAAGGLGADDAGPCGLQPQIERMLDDARADAVLLEWMESWLGLTGFADGRLVDAAAFGVPPELLTSMLGEVHAVGRDALLRDTAPRDLFDGTAGTWVDATLAAHYGVPAPGGEGFQAVEEPSRGGLLRAAALLLATSEPTRSSPVRRGVFVLDRLVCRELGDRPAVVPALPDAPADPTSALESHTANPACANCHKAIDPVGFALEDYGPTGLLRSDLGGAPLPGPREAEDGVVLDTPADLVAWVAAHERLTSCFTDQLATWALRRDVPADEAACRVEHAAAANATGLRGILRTVLGSKAFLQWNGEAP